MLIQTLAERGAIHPPKWLPANTHFLCEMGSVAFGVSAGDSDHDMQGFCFPPKDLVFGHVAGHIPGFGAPFEPYAQWIQHNVKDPDGRPDEYDFTVWSVVKFVELCRQSNANCLDVLFAPRRCIRHMTAIAEHLRDHRHMFLNKEAMKRLRGYAYSQMLKIREQRLKANPKRQADIEAHGYDTKFGYHVVRLCLQAEQILEEHDLDVERNSEILKSIRRGEWSLEQLEAWFATKSRSLEESYGRSTLRAVADEAAMRRLLLEMLEMHYGNLDAVVSRDVSADALARDIENVLARYR